MSATEAELKSIKVEDDTWKTLMRMKLNLGLGSMDAVIQRLLKEAKA